MTAMKRDLVEVRRVGKRGLVTIPKRFWDELGIDGRAGTYIRVEVTGPNEVRLTPDSREAWWRARAVGSRATTQGRQRAATTGAEAFVREHLGFYLRGRVTTLEVQKQYNAWLAVYGDEVPRTSLTHLGRAVKRIVPQVRRSRMINADGTSQPVYINLAFRKKQGEPGQPDERPEDQEEQAAPKKDPPADAADAAEAESPESAPAGDSGDDILNVITDDQVGG